MKRILGSLVLVVTLLTPSLSLAYEQIGLYVAPRVTYGYTQMDKTRDEWSINNYSSAVNKNMKDNVYGYGLAVGYDFNKRFRAPVRAELEYSVFSEASDEKSAWGDYYYGLDRVTTIRQKLQTQTLFVNGYFDFRNATAFTPYVGGGLGLAFIKVRGSYGWADFYGGNPGLSHSVSLRSKSTTNFAWNIGAGAAYAINDNISLDLGYRFASLGGAKTEWADNFHDVRIKSKDVYMHQVTLGLRVAF
ncbi:MAG: outer membrane beta-barrel protein [Betaproteobacteria bacterium]|nr:outer membrane beta-barrel protein [Betaproteobacteria bacterium]